MLKNAKMLDLNCEQIFAVVYDFVKLGIFSTSLTQACAVAMTEILFSLVENIIDRKLRIIH